MYRHSRSSFWTCPWDLPVSVIQLFFSSGKQNCWSWDYSPHLLKLDYQDSGLLAVGLKESCCIWHWLNGINISSLYIHTFGWSVVCLLVANTDVSETSACFGKLLNNLQGLISCVCLNILNFFSSWHISHEMSAVVKLSLLSATFWHTTFWKLVLMVYF